MVRRPLLLAALAVACGGPASVPDKAEIAVEAQASTEPEATKDEVPAVEPNADPEAAHLVPAKVVPKELPKIYDEASDMQAALASKLAAARAGNRRVLVVFGGNWCTWCHKLHMLFERHDGIKKVLAESFEVLTIDSNNNEKLLKDLGIELEGVPFITIFEPDGTIVVRQETGSLEEGPRHEPGKVLSFLEQHKPTEPS